MNPHADSVQQPSDENLRQIGTRPAAEPVSDIVKLQIEVDEAIQSSSAGEALPGAPIDYGAVMKHRLMHKVNDDWIPASEFLFGLPDKTWVQKTHELPDEWRIDYERRWTGRQIADGIARALNPALSRQAPAAPAARGYAGYLAGIVQTWVEMCLKDGKDWRPALAGVIERRLWLAPTPAEPAKTEAGEIAYQLTKRLVIDMPTARAAVDAAIKSAAGKESS